MLRYHSFSWFSVESFQNVKFLRNSKIFSYLFLAVQNKFRDPQGGADATIIWVSPLWLSLIELSQQIGWSYIWELNQEIKNLILTNSGKKFPK